MSSYVLYFVLQIICIVWLTTIRNGVEIEYEKMNKRRKEFSEVYFSEMYDSVDKTHRDKSLLTVFELHIVETTKKLLRQNSL